MTDDTKARAVEPHRRLCDLAVRWLRRPFSALGHGCNFAVSECQSGWGSGEVPDAIGYRAVGHRDGTVVVEVKVSRSDFLADRAKPHRRVGGMGNWRYFMTPTGLLNAAELPPRWGLIEANERGHLRLVAGAAALFNDYTRRAEEADWRHESDTHAELALLIRLMARVGDPELMNRRLAGLNRHNGSLIREVERLRESEKRLQADLMQARFGAANPREESTHV